MAHIQSALIESTFRFVWQFGWNPHTIKSCMYQKYFLKSNLVPDSQIWFGLLNWLNLLNRVPNSDQIYDVVWIKSRNWTESMFWITLEPQGIPLRLQVTYLSCLQLIYSPELCRYTLFMANWSPLLEENHQICISFKHHKQEWERITK